MSWLFSQALVAEYSAGTCSDGELCAPLSGSPTPQAFLPSDRMMAFSRPSRFGMTFAPLTEDRGEELLKLCREDFRARTYPLPEREQALTEPDPACGGTWRGSWARFDPASSSWRTAQPSLLGDSDECSVTWPRSGMTAAGQCWELPMWAPPHQRDRFWLVAYAHQHAGNEGGTGDASQSARGRDTYRSLERPHDLAHSYGVRELQPQGGERDQWRRTCHSGAELPHPDLKQHESASHAGSRQGEGARGSLLWCDWSTEPDVGRVADGVAARVDRLKAIGNGQVPRCAATAWRMLTSGMSNTHNV